MATAVRLVGPWALILPPVAFLVVYGLLRDVPPTAGCDEGSPDKAQVDAYRAGAHALFAIGEVLAIAVYLAALRAAAAVGGGGTARTAPVVAACAGIAAAAALGPSVEIGLGGALVVGTVAAMLAVVLLLRVAGRTWSWPLLLATLALVVLLAASAFPGAATAALTASVSGNVATFTGDDANDTLIIDEAGGMLRHNQAGVGSTSTQQGQGNAENTSPEEQQDLESGCTAKPPKSKGAPSCP